MDAKKLEKAVKELILLLDIKANNSGDIDSPSFINMICKKTGLTKEEYRKIMSL